jgi:hypothetical protein
MRPAINGCLSDDLITKDQLSCPVCLSPFQRNKHNHDFCSPKCRLISWYANQFLEAFKAGKANGLRELIKELVEAAQK